MAFAVVQAEKKSFSGSTSSTKAFTSNVTAGNLILVPVAVYDPANPTGNTITTPTDTQSNVYVPVFPNELIFTSNGTANRQHLQWYKTFASSTGALTVTAGQTNSSGVFNTFFCLECSGVDAFAILNRSSSRNNSPGTAADSGTFTVPNGAVLMGFIARDAGVAGDATFTEGSGFSNIIKEPSALNQPAAAEYKVISGSGDYVADYTIDSNRWGMLGIALLPVESDAGGFTPPTLSDAGISDGTQSALGFPDIVPAALYDASAGTAGKTIVPYLGSTTSKLQVVTYDHNSGTWDAKQTDVATGGVNDGHGAPSIVKTASSVNAGGDNKYHIFWGCHTGALLYVKSNSASDPSAWTAQTSPESACSYPNAFYFTDGNLVLFYRNGGHTADWVYNRSTNNGASWAGPGSVIDSTAANVYYLNIVADPTTANLTHWVVTWEDEADSAGAQATGGYPQYVSRFGLYYFKFDWDGSQFIASDGATRSVASPIDKTWLDAHCVVRSAVTTSGAWQFDLEPEVRIGLDGYPAILSTRGLGIYHTVSFLKYNGSTWSSPVTVCESGVDHVNDLSFLTNPSANVWNAFVVRKGSSGLAGDADATSNPVDIGGNLDLYQSTNNGAAFTRLGRVSSRSSLNYVRPVKNGIAPVKYLVSDWTAIGSAAGHIFGFTDPASATSVATTWLWKA